MKGRYCLIFMTYIVLAFIVIWSFLTHEVNMGWLFDSDTVYLSILFSDVFVNHHRFLSWHLTPAPYFFPDMAIFFLINAAVKNIFIAFMAYAVFQVSILLFLISKITILVTKNKNALLFAHIFFLLSITWLATQNIIPYAFAILSVYHFGSLINGLILIVFLLLYKNHPARKFAIALFVFSAIGAASDLFFVLWYVLPIIAACITVKKIKYPFLPSIKNLCHLLFWGSILGVIIKACCVIDASGGYLFSFSKTPGVKISDFFSTFVEIFSKNPTAGVLMLVFYVAILVRFFHVALNRNNKYQASSHCSVMVFLHCFILISATWAVLNIIFSKLGGLKIDTSSFRYLLNFYWFPIVFCWLPFLPFSSKTVVTKLLVIFYSIILVLCVMHKKNHSEISSMNYYPELVSCIDTGIGNYNSHHQEKIQYGVSGYWQAKITTAFSKENLVILAFKPSLLPQLIINTPEIYRDSYDFAVVDNSVDLFKLNVVLLEEINGKPAAQFDCGKNINILIYGKNKLHMPQLLSSK